MKRILGLAIILLVLLVGCNEEVVKDGEFNFTEDEFISAYEKINNKNFPTNIYCNPGMIRIEDGELDEVISFLNAASKMTKEKKVEWLKESLENNESNIPQIISSKKYRINLLEKNDKYLITIVPDAE